MSGILVEAKKEDFQHYLEKSGVIDILTKVLVGLYEVPEKPANAVTFIQDFMSARSISDDTDQLKEENETLKAKCKALEAEVAELKAAKEPPAE